ncbi:MAG: hypothetical protein ACOH15_08080 [Acetobacterium sp.]
MKLSLGKCWGLLIFDIIGLVLSGYAYLLVFQVLAMLPNADIFIILMGIFIGIKVVILALYDLNQNLLLKNIPFIAALISVIGNGIIFGIALVLMPEVPMSFFIGLAICDFIVILLCHLLWWVLIGKDDEEDDDYDNDDDQEIVAAPKSAGQRKSWLSHSDEEESEYDSIFTTLLANEKKGSQTVSEEIKPGIYEDEKRYQTSEFLKDIKLSLAKSQDEPKQSSEEKAVTVAPADSSEPMPVDDPIIQNTEVSNEETIVLPIISPTVGPSLSTEEKPEKKTKNMKDLFNDLPNVERSEVQNQNNLKSEQEALDDKDMKEKMPCPDETAVENEEDFLSIERRLGYLFYEIEKSMEETHFLQGAVSDFHEAIETYTPITGDEKIIATGNLIREKLKAIVDKQFIVDEVLDDLIRLSKLINNRIDDLDVIESGLNRRKIALDQKEVLTVEERHHEVVEADIEIMPEEVILENLDSEFIIAEGDYESIRKYLTQNNEN